MSTMFTACGGELTAPQGQITSPNFPNNYEHNDGCAWLISAPEGERIRVGACLFLLCPTVAGHS